MFDTKATGIKRSVKQSIRTKSRQIRHFHLKVIDINRKRSSDLLLRRFGEKKNSSGRFYGPFDIASRSGNRRHSVASIAITIL